MPLSELNNITPVILAGGKGERLRPLTNVDNPKPFLKLFSEYSLFQETLLRAANMAPPVVVTHHLYAQRVHEEMKAVGVRGRIIAEPEGKSTAPAIALAALMLEERNAPMLVMPSDHYIEDTNGFLASIAMAHKALGDSAAVLLGAPPRGPETRYGYIRAGHTGRVEAFIEKPDLDHARVLLRSGLCYWNTGIFMMRPQQYLLYLDAFAPDIYEATDAAYRKSITHASFLHPDGKIYAKNRLAAVDRAIMENIVKGVTATTQTATVVPLRAPWQDVGSWGALVGTKLKLIKKRVNKNAHDNKQHTNTKR